MSNTRTDLLTPMGGRLVQGNLYTPKTTDAEGNLILYKTGPKTGQVKPEYFFAVAIPKGNETHWNQTEWGANIWNTGLASFPNGQALSPSFAWKIIDGDSMIPNSNQIKPCSREGFAGHWVLNFKGINAPQIVNHDGSKNLLDKDYVNPGDYVQVFGNITSNKSTQSPGVHLNCKYVSMSGYGERISLGPDPKSVGFGGALPPGASVTPVGAGLNPSINTQISPLATITPVPVMSTPQSVVIPYPQPEVPYPQPVVPYPQILTPPVPAAPVIPPPAPIKKMSPTATAPYEAYIAAGYTDELMIRDGFLLP